MKVCHSFNAAFDDPNLVSFGGLPAVMALAEQAGLHHLVDEHVTVPGTAGSNAAIKVSGLVAGMICGADSISDLDVLRHGGMGRVFDRLRAPTTLGTHLRGYRFGHVRQLDAVASRLLVNLPSSRRSWTVPTSSSMWMWMTRSGKPTGIASRGLRTATPG